MTIRRKVIAQHMPTPQEIEARFWKALKSDMTLMLGLDGVEDGHALPLLVPDRDDHVRAAILRNHCRRNGVQVGTIDALLAQLCMRHDLTMLSTDQDFRRIADHSSLRLWNES
jgi:predicted nucleic acid-binding protein